MNETNPLERDLKQSHRRSYLLRLWRADRAPNSNWQASLEDTRTNERVGFVSVEQLFAYLMTLLERDETRDSGQAKEQS